MAAYATATQLLERYDARTIQDLAGDDGQPLSRIELLSNAVVAAALNDASGEIDSALLVGGVYSPDDLLNVEGNSLYKLISITCEIAITRLFARRPLYDAEKYKAMSELSEKRLNSLRKGENLLAIAGNPGNIEAGTPTVNGLTTVEYNSLGLVVDRSRGYYPRRSLPNGR